MQIHYACSTQVLDQIQTKKYGRIYQSSESQVKLKRRSKSHNIAHGQSQIIQKSA